MVRYIQLGRPTYEVNRDIYQNMTGETFDPNSIEAKIIDSLARNGRTGNGHVLVDNLKIGVPTGQKGQVRDKIKDLKRAGVLESHTTTHGAAISLNASLLKR